MSNNAYEEKQEYNNNMILIPIKDVDLSTGDILLDDENQTCVERKNISYENHYILGD